MFYRKVILPNGRWCMPRGPAPSDRGPGETPARAAHAPGAQQPDPTWGWDIAGEPIDETEGWRPVPAGVDPLADPARWEAWLACSDSEGPPPDPEQRSRVVPGSGGSGAAR